MGRNKKHPKEVQAALAENTAQPSKAEKRLTFDPASGELIVKEEFAPPIDAEVVVNVLHQDGFL